MKDYQLKIWPEITGYLPGSVPLHPQHIVNDGNDIFLDFSNFKKMDSTGATTLLIQILKQCGFDKNRHWRTNANQNRTSKLISSNFFKFLNDYLPNKDKQANSLYFEEDLLTKNMLPYYGPNDSTLSFPIYKLDFNNKQNPREYLKNFKSWLYESLFNYYKKFNFNLPTFVSLMNEIGKNSADHTSENAYFGMDISFSETNFILNFVFGDLGEGIYQNIKKHIPLEHRKGKYGLAEAYRDALKDGFTTKPNSSENNGWGMSTIVEGAKGLNIDLSVFEAQSRGVLTNLDVDSEHLSHKKVRKVFLYTGKEVNFYYFGTLSAKKISDANY